MNPDNAEALPGADMLRFLKDLKAHNERTWFEANRERYERDVREPCLAFVRAHGKELTKVSPHFIANDSRMGGALSRINRDTRFSKDKAPYKIGVSMKFPHESKVGEDAPFFYIHVEPANSFLAGGLRSADSKAINMVRSAIVADPKAWRKLRALDLTLEGESLQRVPAGYPADHEFVDDLRRKDFCAVVPYSDAQVKTPSFVKAIVSDTKGISPLVSFVTRAMRLPY